MTEVSYIWLVEGSHAAREYANKYVTKFDDVDANLNGFKLDHALCDEHQVVFVRRRPKGPPKGQPEQDKWEIRIAYRGTQRIGGDMATNVLMTMGAQHYAPQIQAMEKSLDAVVKAYGVVLLDPHNGESYILPKDTIISGHSKGGAEALYFAELMSHMGGRPVISHTQDP